MNRTKEFYLQLLGILLLEIRNLDDSKLRHARSLAYIFHNVPGMLHYNFSEEKAEKAWKVIMGRAEYFKLSELVEQWEKLVFEILDDEKNAD